MPLKLTGFEAQKDVLLAASQAYLKHHKTYGNSFGNNKLKSICEEVKDSETLVDKIKTEIINNKSKEFDKDNYTFKPQLAYIIEHLPNAQKSFEDLQILYNRVEATLGSFAETHKDSWRFSEELTADKNNKEYFKNNPLAKTNDYISFLTITMDSCKNWKKTFAPYCTILDQIRTLITDWQNEQYVALDLALNETKEQLKRTQDELKKQELAKNQPINTDQASSQTTTSTLTTASQQQTTAITVNSTTLAQQTINLNTQVQQLSDKKNKLVTDNKSSSVPQTPQPSQQPISQAVYKTVKIKKDYNNQGFHKLQPSAKQKQIDANSTSEQNELKQTDLKLSSQQKDQSYKEKFEKLLAKSKLFSILDHIVKHRKLLLAELLSQKIKPENSERYMALHQILINFIDAVANNSKKDFANNKNEIENVITSLKDKNFATTEELTAMKLELLQFTKGLSINTTAQFKWVLLVVLDEKTNPDACAPKAYIGDGSILESKLDTDLMSHVDSTISDKEQAIIEALSQKKQQHVQFAASVTHQM